MEEIKELMTNFKEENKMEEIKELMTNLCEGICYNWLCEGNGQNISKEEYRTLCENLIYGIEYLIGYDERRDVVGSVLANVPECWIDDLENYGGLMN